MGSVEPATQQQRLAVTIAQGRDRPIGDGRVEAGGGVAVLWRNTPVGDCIALVIVQFRLLAGTVAEDVGSLPLDGRFVGPADVEQFAEPERRFIGREAGYEQDSPSTSPAMIR